MDRAASYRVSSGEDVCRSLTEAAVDFRNLLAPATTFLMFEVHKFGIRPMQVIGDECHLLVELIQRIGTHSSPRPFSSGSKSCLQLGQMTFCAAFPSVLSF